MNLSSPIDHGSPTPIYRQLYDWMVEQITTGEWPKGHQLAAEPTAAVELGVSRGTLRKAVSLLVQRGLLVQVHGKGTFVADAVIDQPLASNLSSVSEEFIRTGTPFSTTVLSQQLRLAGNREAEALGLRSGDSVVQLERVRSVDHAPLVLSESFLPAERFASLVDVDFRQTRLFEVLEEQYDVVLHKSHRTMSAITANLSVAKALDVQTGVPVLYSEQTVFDVGGDAVEFSRGWFRADRFRLSSEAVRNEGEPVHAVTLPNQWSMERRS